MEGARQAVREFFVKIYEGAQSVLDASQPWQVLLVIGALLLLVLLLAIGLKVANRAGEAAAMALEESEERARAAQDEAERARERIEKAEEDKAEALERLERAKNQLLSENANQLALARTRIEQLERVQIDESAFLAGVRIEAARIVREAKDYAYTMSNRADAEYAEIMRHAGEEAEALRAMSQQRLDQAHDALKKALHRATEIVQEAHAEAGRANRSWYEAPPVQLMDPEPAAPAAADAARGEPAAEPLQDT